MLSERSTLCGIFGMFFVLSLTFMALGQTTPSEPDKVSAAPAPSQSDTVTIIQEIHASETRIREEIHELDKDMAVLKAKVNIIQWVVTIIGAPVFIYFVTLGVQKFLKRGSESGVSPKTVQPHLSRGSQLKSTDDTYPDYQNVKEVA